MRYPVNYIAITQGLHYGRCIDFGWSNAYGGKNQPVFACDDGVVYRIEKQKNGGNVIYIEHLDGMVSCYAHLADDSIIVKAGDVITKGRQIALMGTTGAASTAITFTFGLSLLSSLPAPLKVPPVPTPATKKSILASVSRQISNAVVCTCARAFSGFENCPGMKEPGICLCSSSAFSKAPRIPFSPGVNTTSAP